MKKLSEEKLNQQLKGTVRYVRRLMRQAGHNIVWMLNDPSVHCIRGRCSNCNVEFEMTTKAPVSIDPRIQQALRNAGYVDLARIERYVWTVVTIGRTDLPDGFGNAFTEPLPNKRLKRLVDEWIENRQHMICPRILNMR